MTPSQQTIIPLDTQTSKKRGVWAAIGVFATLLMIALRLVDLGSDPYKHLDWDTGILTDEGFYLHNARNAILFGHPRMDEFNNMLVSPLIHYLQVAVFKLFGFGLVQARMISVVASLLTILIFWRAMRLAFGGRIAVCAAAFLGLDHINVLFNRMALLDTPATLLAVCAFYAFVRGSRVGEKGANWYVACGVLIALTVITRSLCIYLLPAPFLALLFDRRQIGTKAVMRSAAAVASGLALVFVLYGVLWYLPHATELNHMNHYYRTVQIQPDSVRRLMHNLWIAVAGNPYGIVSYFAKHSPVLALAAGFGVGCWVLGTGKRGDNRADDLLAETGEQVESSQRLAAVYLVWWLAGAVLVYTMSSYSPDRYFVSMLPAVAGLASIGLWRAAEKAQTMVLDRAVLPAAAMLIWVLVNAAWLADWWSRREYTELDMSRWLTANLPKGSVLLGDVAPGAGIATPFQTVNVMEELCNDGEPVERYAGRPAYAMLIDGEWKGPYWVKHYPELVDRRRRILHMRVINWWIGVYPVGSTSYRSASGPDASSMRRK